ncbi:hypothetical protein A3J90_05980 [candidate division WOR-1 bacterium RIFOXYC2_FULL_37_10]|uniref:Four helix bundle protein n=1 Tax=candidate division WOR-1 bacterium RIFOXYB2_FULL_37_13 TaxID=1802579 RepID=A0A1F4SWM5_UNCSA|nr:MAG: hypothetical protein A2246_02795 [candidate division WOR-1 bacterium RIFOXYA2_FULL_37_7]OGC24757.1 MAG: hypothetical protein A2310_04665 [candidate division WOR-1 bacterium RIFOXYB2_FULL_37_13]OGC34783.1 MAG: hypothetical protein A3J90_05980 [candidate division WOR-1 bacterium RIFOXYC2_FULL_37_10]
MFLFENLEVYKKSVELVTKTHQCMKTINDRDIKNQLKRAALSVPLNIAEGNGRNTPKEKQQFYKMARGSLFECIPLIEICLKLGFIPKETFDDIYSIAESIGKMINGLINSLKE